MRAVRYADAAQARVIVTDGTEERRIPTDPAHPVWQDILAAALAGDVEIQPYEPPQTQAQD